MARSLYTRVRIQGPCFGAGFIVEKRKVTVFLFRLVLEIGFDY